MFRCAVLLFSVMSFSWAADKPINIYMCVHPDGSREYRNTDDGGKDCAKLPDLNNLKAPPSEALQALRLKSERIQKERWQKLSPGMTKAAVEKAWRKPNKDQTRRVQTRSGVTEEWRFPGHGNLTFKDDILEAIED